MFLYFLNLVVRIQMAFDNGESIVIRIYCVNEFQTHPTNLTENCVVVRRGI